MGDEFVLDWGALVPLIVHPTKVRIVEAMSWINRPMSARDLEKVLDKVQGLSAISYHVKSLKTWGVLEKTGQRQVRGSTERFYFFSDAIRKGLLLKSS